MSVAMASVNTNSCTPFQYKILFMAFKEKPNALDKKYNKMFNRSG
jgi:hypothetical protein